ncbi:MAG: glycosyltransferase family 4 protein [Oscillospiraceae bacterium]|nr:glycosyltransferase family 4 protein [Oscillospiraceae bacterium]
MNIWLINHYAVPPQYYPLARQTNFAKYLMAMGHEVTIFAASTVHNSDKNLITDGAKWREETVDGVHYVYIKCKDYLGSGLKRVYNICEFAWKLPGVCKRFSKPDAIVATSMPPTSCAMGIRLARKYGCRGIAEIADLWPESIVAYGIAGPKNPAVIALRWLEKWIYKKADAVVFTMENAYQYIKEQGWEQDIPESKVFYVNNGVDLSLFEANRARFPVEDPDLDDPGIFKVVYTGSIRKVNNLGLLLDAAKKVTDPSVRFLIWGDGDELDSLRQRVAEENISNVCFKGRVAKSFVPSIVSRADLNIAHNTPSSLFVYGISFNKLFDYLAAGKPVLSDFPCGHNPAVVWGAGTEVNDPTPENIARAIEDFVHMDSQTYTQYSQNAAAAAKAYSFEALTKKLYAVIEKKEKV